MWSIIKFCFQHKKQLYFFWKKIKNSENVHINANDATETFTNFSNIGQKLASKIISTDKNALRN